MVRRVTLKPRRPDRLVQPLLELCVRGPAVSQRAKGKGRLRKWKDRVATAAREAMPSPPDIFDESIRVHLVEFSGFATKDRDNFAKPILDALQAIAYENDRQVLNLHVEWRDINGAYKVRFMSPVVAQAMVQGYDFVWIRLARHIPSQGLD